MIGKPGRPGLFYQITNSARLASATLIPLLISANGYAQAPRSATGAEISQTCRDAAHRVLRSYGLPGLGQAGIQGSGNRQNEGLDPPRSVVVSSRDESLRVVTPPGSLATYSALQQSSVIWPITATRMVEGQGEAPSTIVETRFNFRLSEVNGRSRCLLGSIQRTEIYQENRMPVVPQIEVNARDCAGIVEEANRIAEIRRSHQVIGNIWANLRTKVGERGKLAALFGDQCRAVMAHVPMAPAMRSAPAPDGRPPARIGSGSAN